MIDNKKVIGIIPARGGSKGLPGKNIRPLLGKPLIEWTIEHGLAAEYIDEVMVTTDSEEIATISRQAGAQVPFIRPAELASDTASSMDVVYHVLDWYRTNKNQEFDMVCLLEPTSPLRAPGDLDKAIRSLADNYDSADAVISLGEVHMENPFIMKTVKERFLEVMFPGDSFYQRQQLPKAYFPYGVVYLTKTTSLYSEKTFYAKRTLPYYIERWQNYEVDDVYDFLCIEAVLKYKREAK